MALPLVAVALRFDPAHRVDAQHSQEPAEGEKGADTNGQIEDLVVAKRRSEACEEGVIDGEMVGDEPLGILDRHPLLLAVAGIVAVLGYVRVQLLVDTLPRRRRGSKFESDRTVVQLGYPHARCFPHTGGQLALVVGSVDHGGHAGSHLRPELPNLYGITAVTGRDVDARHGERLYPARLPTAAASLDQRLISTPGFSVQSGSSVVLADRSVSANKAGR